MRRIYEPTSAALLLGASALALSLAVAAPTVAQTWTGATNGIWHNTANWSGGVLPTSGTTVVVSGPLVNTPTIDGGVATASILYVGYPTASGGTSLALQNGAQLTTSTAKIGENDVNNTGDLLELQSGSVSLSSGSTWSTSSLHIGAFGTGLVNVTGGSQIMISSNLDLGNSRSSTTGRFGSGTLNISGTNSKVTSSATTTIGSGDATDGGTGVVTVEGGGQFVTASAVVGSSPLGSGTVTINGAGSRWDATAGTTVIGQNGTGQVTITNGGVLSNPGRMLVLGGGSGSGNLSVSGTGSQVVAGQIRIGGDGNAPDGSGTLSATAGATINATHLMLGNTAGALGTATFSGANTTANATTYTMVGWNGQGTLTLSDGATLHTPNTLIGYSAGSQGAVNIGAASGSAATAPGTLDGTTITFGAGTGSLVLNHTGSNYTLAPKIAGSGTINHLAGVTNLSGASSTFAGNTIVDGGTLKVLGALGGNIAVNSGGTLGGNGTVGNTQLNAGSTINPDGTLNVSGNLNFASGSTYRADAGNGTSDQIAATGTVTISGGAVNLQTAGKNFSREESYKILGGSVLTGTFDSLTTQSAFLDALLDYSHSNEVRVNLSRNDVAFQSVAAGSNQQVIAHILGALPSNHPLVAAMLGLSAEEAREAMNQLSGDTQATLETAGASIAGQVQNVLMNRIRQAFSAIGAQGSAVSSYAPRLGEVDAGERPDISYWLQGLGEYAHVDATATSGGLRSGTAGILGGSDVAINEWRVGVVGGYTGTGYTAEGRPADGSINDIHAGIYAGAEFDALSVQFNALQTWHGISSRRNVSFGGLNETLTADYGAQTSLVFGEVGYGFDLGAVELEPFGSVAYSLGQTDAYSESGGASALSVAASTQQSVTTVIGVRPEMAFAIDDKLLTVRGMLGWQHQAGETPTGSYSLAGSSPFTVTGSSLASDALVYETGLNLDVSENLNLDLLYSGRLAPTDFSQGIKGIVAAKF